MEKFIAFKGAYENSYKIYQFDGTNCFRNIEDNDKGFQLSDFEKYSHSFLKAETLDGIKEETRKAEYQLKYGKGESGDARCPHCGFWHSFDYVDYNDDYYTAGINEGFSEKRQCLCGKVSIFKIKEIKVIWDIEDV